MVHYGYSFFIEVLDNVSLVRGQHFVRNGLVYAENRHVVLVSCEWGENKGLRYIQGSTFLKAEREGNRQDGMVQEGEISAIVK